MIDREHFHFIGIGGIGMSGLANILLEKQKSVSGSDLVASTITANLQTKGARVSIGHDVKNVQAKSVVIYNSDIKEENPEFAAAKALKCPTIHRSELLNEFIKGHKSVVVTGMHGKTTTSSLIACVLDASFAVGGIVRKFQSNARYFDGCKYFVAEGDESDKSFLIYHPFSAIITNIDYDHMENFKTEENLCEAFQTFCNQVQSKNHLFWCYDDQRLRKICKQGISYGFDRGADLQIINFRQKEWKIFFDISYRGKKYLDIEVALIGKFNALNSSAVFGLALELGVDEKEIRKALSSFQGVVRRCEHLQTSTGLSIIDDYGHHPKEITVVLQAIRDSIGERQMIVVFQPHSFSRVKYCFQEFLTAFEQADKLFVTEIYAASEKPIRGISSKRLVQELKHHHLDVSYVDKEALCFQLSETVRPHDVVVFVNAGDITKIAHHFAKHMINKKMTTYRVAVIAGGKSVEHEVSLISSERIVASLNDDYYTKDRFVISKEGKWSKWADGKQVKKEIHEVIKELKECDVVFPILHGPYGEDGKIQGMLEMMDLPYVGPDHCSSAICMDKVVTMRIVESLHIPVVPYMSLEEWEWRNHQEEKRKEIKEKIGYPLFIKPVHLGSSVGVQKVEDSSQLEKAIEEALQFDYSLIVEEAIEGREIEFAVLGNDEVIVYPPGEVITNGKIYDYQSKYGKDKMDTTPKADLPDSEVQEWMKLIKEIYLANRCTSMARIDCFLDKEGHFLFREINPIPGFTPISLFPLMCKVNGLDYDQLLDKLIILALERARKRQRKKTTYVP